MIPSQENGKRRPNANTTTTIDKLSKIWEVTVFFFMIIPSTTNNDI